jgi:hypothetical protein
MPRSIKDTYTECSGQNAVKAELLHRMCNVAVPEVDVGEDVLAFRDGDANISRIQVKTANAKRRRRRATPPSSTCLSSNCGGATYRRCTTSLRSGSTASGLTFSLSVVVG